MLYLALLNYPLQNSYLKQATIMTKLKKIWKYLPVIKLNFLLLDIQIINSIYHGKQTKTNQSQAIYQ
jgi:hypothetical protein